MDHWSCEGWLHNRGGANRIIQSCHASGPTRCDAESDPAPRRMNCKSSSNGVVLNWLDCYCRWRNAYPVASVPAQSIVEDVALDSDASVPSL